MLHVVDTLPAAQEKLDEAPVHPVLGQVRDPRVAQGMGRELRRQAQRVPVGDETRVDLGRPEPAEFTAATASSDKDSNSLALAAAYVYVPRLYFEETDDAYVQAVRGAATKAVANRFLLQEDADKLIAQAAGSSVR